MERRRQTHKRDDPIDWDDIGPTIGNTYPVRANVPTRPVESLPIDEVQLQGGLPGRDKSIQESNIGPLSGQDCLHIGINLMGLLLVPLRPRQRFDPHQDRCNVMIHSFRPHRFEFDRNGETPS